MAILRNMEQTMEKSIKSAKGRVLVLGLGMGYITYMLSNKKDVTAITVIEKNKENIEIIIH